MVGYVSGLMPVKEHIYLSISPLYGGGEAGESPRRQVPGGSGARIPPSAPHPALLHPSPAPAPAARHPAPAARYPVPAARYPVSATSRPHRRWRPTAVVTVRHCRRRAPPAAPPHPRRPPASPPESPGAAGRRTAQHGHPLSEALSRRGPPLDSSSSVSAEAVGSGRCGAGAGGGAAGRGGMAGRGA